MSLQDDRIFGSRGDIVCRKAVWTDVVKFFLLNYGLHAFTVISSPGAMIEPTVLNILCALICPMSGVTTAIVAMQSLPRLLGKARRSGAGIWPITKLFDDKLAMAHSARALCMLVPWELNERFGGTISGFQGLCGIHGQLPFPRRTFTQRLRSLLWKSLDGSVTLSPEEGGTGQRYGLVIVPWYFEISPLLNESPNGRQTEISCDYNIIKPLAAIFQICYGSFELYEARGSQIDKFGYAAYSFTIIPYIVMSFVNLIATMCGPSYPCMYIVHYGGKLRQTEKNQVDTVAARPVVEEQQEGEEDGPVVLEVAPTENSEEGNENTHGHECDRELEHLVSGAVGCAHIVEGLAVPQPVKAGQTIIWNIVSLSLLLAFLSPTYIIMYLLSSFDGRQSTTVQRVWIISSLVIGNALWVILILVNNILHYLYPPRADGTTPAAGTPWRGLRAIIPSIDTLRSFRNICLALLAVPSLGAFVVVAQMIVGHETCVQI